MYMQGQFPPGYQGPQNIGMAAPPITRGIGGEFGGKKATAISIGPLQH